MHQVAMRKSLPEQLVKIQNSGRIVYNLVVFAAGRRNLLVGIQLGSFCGLQISSFLCTSMHGADKRALEALYHRDPLHVRLVLNAESCLSNEGPTEVLITGM